MRHGGMLKSMISKNRHEEVTILKSLTPRRLIIRVCTLEEHCLRILHRAEVVPPLMGMEVNKHIFVRPFGIHSVGDLGVTFRAKCLGIADSKRPVEQRTTKRAPCAVANRVSWLIGCIWWLD